MKFIDLTDVDGHKSSLSLSEKTEKVTVLGVLRHGAEFRFSEMDRIVADYREIRRPFTVGHQPTGVILGRFVREIEASCWLRNFAGTVDPDGLERGDYYIDGPERR